MDSVINNSFQRGILLVESPGFEPGCPFRDSDLQSDAIGQLGELSILLGQLIGIEPTSPRFPQGFSQLNYSRHTVQLPSWTIQIYFRTKKHIR